MRNCNGRTLRYTSSSEMGLTCCHVIGWSATCAQKLFNITLTKQPVDRESNFGVTLTNNVTNDTADLTFWPCCITAQHKWLSCALCRVLHHDNHCQLQQRMQACKLIGHVLYIEPFHSLFIYKIQIDLLMFMALAASSNRSVCICIFRLFFKAILWNFHIFAYMIEITIISLLLLAKVT